MSPSQSFTYHAPMSFFGRARQKMRA